MMEKIITLLKAFGIELSADWNFNPRPPWGGRPACGATMSRVSSISIHALRGEGDRTLQCAAREFFRFQSTPSVGRATANC